MSENTPLHEIDSATEAGTIAALAERASKVDVHVIDVKATNGRDVIEQHVYGRGYDGELNRIDTINVAAAQHDHASIAPDRLAGAVTVHTPKTLVTYAKRHFDEDRSTLWGDVENARLTVVLNDHTPRIDDEDQLADWGDHRAVLDLKPSPEWQAWTRLNEKGMSQEELAEFLEERLVEIVRPDGSDLLEVTRTFQATTGATFRRAQSLHSGQVQLTWQEDGEAKAGSSGQLEVPRDFSIALRPFLGTEPVEVTGMFRYRVSSGQLSLGFRLLNLDEHRRTAVEAVLATVSDDLGLVPFEGVAPGARR